MVWTIQYTFGNRVWTQGLYADKVMASINVNLNEGHAALVELPNGQHMPGRIVPALQFDGERWA